MSKQAWDLRRGVHGVSLGRWIWLWVRALVVVALLVYLVASDRLEWWQAVAIGVSVVILAVVFRAVAVRVWPELPPREET